MATHLHISHAPEDISYARRLTSHLASTIRAKRLTVWHEELVEPGERRADARRESFLRANIVVHLLSSDASAHDECWFEGAQLSAGGERVHIPVRIRPVRLTDSPFEGRVTLPASGIPISVCSSPEEAYVEVASAVCANIRTDSGQILPDATIEPVSHPSPAGSTLAADTERIVREELRGINTRPAQAVIMDPYRRLVFRFCTLAQLDRDRILAELKLVESTDAALDEPMRWGRAFERARDRGQLAALWDAVERRHPERTNESNPFATK